MEHWWNENVWKTRVLTEKPVSVPLCPPRITHGLTWNWTHASVVRSQWLTISVMAHLSCNSI